MERLSHQHTSGVNSSTLRAFGIFFVVTGVFGRCILQRNLLGIGSISAEQLLELMESSQYAMILASISLVLQALETCAIPIFCALLVEGFLHTSCYYKYLLRVCGAALLSEIPYNLAMSGNFLDLSSRNPMFGLVLGLFLMFFYQRFAGKTGRNILIRLIVTVAALLWTLMLNVENGIGIIAAVTVLWAFHDKPLLRNLVGIVVMAVCSIFSPFLLASPMGFLAVHFYNGEQGNENRWINYLFYPVILAGVGILGTYVF